jgi:hypothetical protein
MKSSLFTGVALLAISASAAADLPAPPVKPFDCGEKHNPNIMAELIRMPAHFGMQKAYIVNVRFVGPKPTDAEATLELKRCLAAVMDTDMSQNIIVMPWYRKSPKSDPDLDLLLEPFPEHQALIYDVAKRQVLMTRPGLDHETRQID